MDKERYSVTGKLVMFEDYEPSWTYLFIPFNMVPDVDPGGWGSIPVEVTCGKSSWTTSLFPLKKEGYFLPMKKPILKKENLKVGDTVAVSYSSVRKHF